MTASFPRRADGQQTPVRSSGTNPRRVAGERIGGKTLTRICLIAETSPAFSIAARRTTTRIPPCRLRGGVAVGLCLLPSANGLRPRADGFRLQPVTLGRLGCRGSAADLQIHSGLRGAGSLPFHRGSAVCQDLRREITNRECALSFVAVIHEGDSSRRNAGKCCQRMTRACQ